VQQDQEKDEKSREKKEKGRKREHGGIEADLVDLFDDPVVVAADLLARLGVSQPVVNLGKAAAVRGERIKKAIVLLARPRARQLSLPVAVA